MLIIVIIIEVQLTDASPVYSFGASELFSPMNAKSVTNGIHSDNS